MKNVFKTIVLLVLILVVAMNVIVPFAAAYDYQDDSAGYEIVIQDDASLLSNDEIEDLAFYIEDRFDGMHYNVLVLTVNDADGKNTMTYTDDYMDALFSEENNIGFIIDMDNREIYINTMGNAIKCLTDDMIESALDAGYVHVEAQNYYSCFTAMISYCSSRMSDDPTDVGYVGESNTFMDGLASGLIPAAIVTGIMVFILIMNHNKANKGQKATTYVSRENYEIIDKDETFIRTYETVIKDAYKPSSSSSSSGHSGGSSHRSSSGRSHGGGGRKF